MIIIIHNFFHYNIFNCDIRALLIRCRVNVSNQLFLQWAHLYSMCAVLYFYIFCSVVATYKLIFQALEYIYLYIGCDYRVIHFLFLFFLIFFLLTPKCTLVPFERVLPQWHPWDTVQKALIINLGKCCNLLIYIILRNNPYTCNNFNCNHLYFVYSVVKF